MNSKDEEELRSVSEVSELLINFSSSDCPEAYDFVTAGKILTEMEAGHSPKSMSFVLLLSFCFFFASVRSVPSLIGVHPLGNLIFSLSFFDCVLDRLTGSGSAKLKIEISSAISPLIHLTAPFGVYPYCQLMLNWCPFGKIF